ncbi:uncharacterized protein LOC106666841 [Cimex lectularius]|uniref:BAG family molecular chaperone regulator 2 n=1 Tax=Cimex lectularius TaxID=79782 RepID=A0A8I6RNY6_CIMLE|nr:uncharacterized protein LOC106666841 [Cimex lectularius]XP_014249806.1 uncharacterized protein LOC106666841 [Cimex lectularius]XP_014249807.1 uncharacterized protein LOC106666841 [Cimex lectularius]XP_014249808.1 uncharacterized protein LOC106666841 [Cimex lectularius]
MDQLEFQEPMDTTKHPKDRIVDHLVQIEKHVECLRKETFILEGLKNTLMATLDSLKCSDLLGKLEEQELEDVLQYVDRVANKCLTIDVSVRTTRNLQEEDALHRVNNLIDDVVVSFRDNWAYGKLTCESYLSACCEIVGVAPNETFKQLLTQCSEDDQNIIANRISGLLNYMNGINKLTVTELN